MGRKGHGHRGLPHTADIRVEAWGRTREECIAEAVLASVEAFVDTASATATTTRTTLLEATGDEDLLVAVLDEVAYLLDVAGEVPVGVVLVVLEGRGVGAEVRFLMAPVEGLPQVGALPKAVSLHGLRIEAGPEGWSCAVTLDV